MGLGLTFHRGLGALSVGGATFTGTTWEKRQNKHKGKKRRRRRVNQPKVVSINNQHFDCTSGTKSDTTRRTPGGPMSPLQLGAKTSYNWLEPNGSGFNQCQAVKAS